MIFQSCSRGHDVIHTRSNLVINGDVALKELAPNDQKALVYIVRSSRVASAIKIPVEVNGKELGLSYAKRFLYTFLPPGKYEFLSHSENYSTLPIELKSNQTYFIEIKPQAGLVAARNKLVRLPDDEGRKKILKCKLSSDNATLEGF